MSPEQARGERVDARTDLFSLGSVLYFMCTRKTPFHADETLAILSRVCEETPTPIRQINPEVPVWLAALIEKLQAKDPAKRVQSAAEVAEVLSLHLAHLRDPVPAPRRRRRWAVAATILGLLGGLALTEATRVTRFAATVIDIFTREDASLVKGKTVPELSTTAARIKAEPAELPPEESAVELAEKALEKDPDSGLLLKNLGTAYYRAGRWQLAADTLARADKVGQDINQSFSPFMRAMAHWQLDHKALAHRWYAAANVWLARTGSKDPELLSLRAEAAKLLDLREQLSEEQKQAVSDYDGKYLTLVLEADPEATWAYRDRGRGFVKNKKWNEAEADFRRAVEILENYVKERRDHPNRWRLALVHQDLAEVLLYHLSPPEAKEAAKSRQRQVELYEQLVKEFSRHRAHREQLGHAYRWQAFDLERIKQPAETAFGKAIDYLEQLVDEFPDSPGYRGLLADTYDRFRRHLAASGKPTEEAFEKTILVLKGFPAKHVTTPAVRVSLSEFHHRRGNLLREAKRPVEAEAAYREAIAVLEELAKADSKERSYRQELGRNHNWLGIVLAQIGQQQKAEEAHREALGIYEKLTAETEASASRWHRQELAWTCLNLGEAVEKARGFAEAMDLYRRAGELCEKLATEHPDGTYPHWERHAYGKLIQLLTGTGQPDEAMVICRKLLEQKPPHSGQALNMVAWSLISGADAEFWAPELAVLLAEKAVELAPNSADCWNTLGVAHYRAGDFRKAISELKKSDALEGPNYFELNGLFLAMAHRKAGEEEQARKWYTAALVWMEKRNAKNDLLLRARDDAASLLGLPETLSPEQEQAKADEVKLAELVIEANADSSWAYDHRGRAFGRAKEWDKAITDFSRAIDLKKGHWLAWADRGWARNSLKQFDQAIEDFSKALELNAAVDWVRRERGKAHGNREEWDKALLDYSKALGLKPDDPLAHFLHALLRLHVGGADAHRTACTDMLSRFRNSPNLEAVYWTAWTCSLSADAVPDWQPVVELAEKVLAAEPKNCDKLQLLGAVLYRAGRFDAALKRLTEAEAAFVGAQKPRSTVIYNWLYSAMTQHRLGEAAEAKRFFKQAVDAIDQPPDESKDQHAAVWNRRLTLQLWRAEAQRLLGKD